VNQNNGGSRINATLDPSLSDCISSYNFGSAVTVDLVGKFDGNYRNSGSGTGKELSGGVNSKYNVKSDEFSETFTGTIGGYEGTFTGEVGTIRFSNRQRVK
jgi:hypothetical protein